MHKIADLVKFILYGQNIGTYLSLFAVLFLLALTGSVIFFELFRTKNKLKVIGGGMICGALAFFLVISIISYIFKGELALKLTFFLYCVTFGLLIFKRKNIYREVLITRLRYQDIATIAVILMYAFGIVLYAGNTIVGGDLATYLGISSSSARGNYPTVLSWQPDFLTVYHHGAFMLQGAIHAIARIDPGISHFFFAMYLIVALFVYTVGIAREKTRSLFCLIPAIFGIIVFSPILLVQGFPEYITNLGKLFPLSPATLQKNSSLFTQFYELKGSIGAGANNLA
jgi:hypothetical protein